MNVPKAIALAEIRHAELLGQAAQHRLARRAARPHSGRRRWGHVWRDAVLALRACESATRRPDLMKPADLAPAAETT
jgi:hypothetical protein